MPIFLQFQVRAKKKLAMPSAKERMAKYRAKCKNDTEQYQALLKKDRERKAKKRAEERAKKSEAELQAQMLKERERVRAYRARKREEIPQNESAGSSSAAATCTSTSSATPYRCPQTLGKAVKRAMVSLPVSPRKQRCVIGKLAASVGLSITGPRPIASSSPLRLSDETQQLVQAFYQSGDISWQAPGRKDHVTIRDKNDDGSVTKRVEQTRYMLMSLREAYHKFVEEYPTNKIGLSKFCELRPEQVKLYDNIPHQVCVCQYHENIRLLLVALQAHTDLKGEFSEFINQITCDSTSKECMTRKCSACADLLLQFSPRVTHPVSYRQWRSTDGRAEKITFEGTTEDAFHELKEQSQHFLFHSYVKRKQAASFKKLTESCDNKNIVIQVDYSENATIVAQREIQSAHWCHSQATLFTVHAWLSGVDGESMVIISDDLNHTKQSVYVCMQAVFTYLRGKYPHIEHVNVFSDGPTSQFKQRYLFSNLHSWEKEYDFKLTWNFFATSHGKGVVDGIGGTVKRTVWRHIKAERAHVTDAKEYAELAQKLCPNIYVQYIPASAIESHTEFLSKKWESVLLIPGTLRVHCVRPSGEFKVQVATTSDEKEFRICPICADDRTQPPPDSTEHEASLTNEHDLMVGQWVVVVYDEHRFPGEIVSISNVPVDVQVNVMLCSVCTCVLLWPNSAPRHQQLCRFHLFSASSLNVQLI